MGYAFFLFFIVSVFLFGSFVIGPASVRVLSTFIMTILLLIHITKINRIKLSNRLILLYCLFLIFMSLAMINNGEYEKYELIKNLLAYHLVCIVSYYAVRYYVSTEKALSIVSSLIIIIVVLNSVVTAMQYFNMTEGWAINLLLTGERNEAIVDYSNALSEGDSFVGIARTPGLFDSVVFNSMFMSSFGLVTFVFLFNNSVFFKKITYWLILALSIVAVFMCQERSALFIYLIAIVFLIIQNSNKMVFVLASSFFIFVSLFFYDDLLLNLDFGRFTSVSVNDDLRADIWKRGVSFISDNIMWGGPLKFVQITGHTPHNFFLNAFVYGGLFGGFTIIVLFFAIMIKAIKFILNRFNSKEKVFAVALCSYLFQGMLHNASLVTGSVTIFILLALMESSNIITLKKQQLR